MLEGCGKDREILVGTGATIRDYPYGMPILDHDPDFGWLVMPLVTRSLRRHCPPGPIWAWTDSSVRF